MIAVGSQLRSKLMSLVKEIYPEEDAAHVARRIIEAFWPDGLQPRQRARPPGNSLWSERDSIVITYGNAVLDGEHKPLDLLYDLLKHYLSDAITGVHILPFFPFTSDDGFSVTDYEKVNSRVGDWTDINRIGDEFRLMSDLVLNHMSSQSKWFSEYLQGHPPFDKYSSRPRSRTTCRTWCGRAPIRCCARWRPPTARAMSGAHSPMTRSI